ncbi:MAG: ATP-binding protein [Patescibacteria group bacterium]|jgi:PAS domain S-box-containing protein
MKVASLLKRFGLFIIIMTLLEFGVLYFFIHNSESDAKIINYSGLVRGLAQRVFKLDYAGHYSEAESYELQLDKIIIGLKNGDESLGLKKLNNDQFQLLMNDVSTDWEKIKKTIELSKNQPDAFSDLLRQSEDFFILTDRSVRAAEEAARNKVVVSEAVQLVLFILEVVALIFLMIIIKRRVVTPLNIISKILPKAAGGDLSQHLPMKGSDEFGEIADVFNKLLIRQREFTGSLEKKVKEKTRELEIKIIEVEGGKEKVEEEKKQIEKLLSENEKFRLAIEGASDHIIITDSEGFIMYANKAAEEITGYSTGEMFRKKAGQLWGGLMDKKYYENLWKVIKVEGKPFKGLVKNHRKNGEIYDAAVSISPILDKNNKPIFFIGLERDVSKEVAVDRAKTEFTSLASHQLRTPLTAIRWYSELLLSGKAGKINKKQTEFIKEIFDGNKRMITLVNNLLSVSRLELGTLPIHVVSADLCVILNDVVKELKPDAIGKKVKIEYVCLMKKLVVMIDESLIRMIFQNLISNAIKYSLEKGVVKIEMKSNQDNIIVSVIDNGIGIPIADQKNIYNKFFRANNAGKIQADGTGLGLYIVKSVVDFVGGKISFKSKEGYGTEFVFEVPLSGMKEKK